MNDEFDISVTLPAATLVSMHAVDLDICRGDTALTIRQLYDAETSLERALNRFMSEVLKVIAGPALEGGLLEAAVYYSSIRSAYFKAAFSADTLSQLATLGLNLSIIGYPCSDTE